MRLREKLALSCSHGASSRGQLGALDAMERQVPEVCFRALSAAVFVAHCLNLPAVKRASTTSMTALCRAIEGMQQLCCIEESAQMLAWCKCLFAVAAQSFSEMDESTGDFVLPVPRPKISEFYVAPCPPRPLLELMDGRNATLPT